jgi:Trypsin-like peptidase domain/Colicin V production protein
VVTVVDLIIAGLVLALAALGWERGLIRSALPLIGFLVGAALGARLGPALLADGSESPYAPVVTVASGVLLGAAFAVALEGVGLVVRQRLRIQGVAGVLDGVGGALLLGSLGLLMAWSFGAIALHTPAGGAPELRLAMQRSAILGALNDVLPPSGPLLNVLRRIDPRLALEGPEARVPPPDARIARDPDVRGASDSVVRVLGTACGLGVAGSGWVAAPGLVVTNAHVIAGEDDTTVTSRAGAEFDAEPVVYQPRNDLAVVRVSGLDAPPLPIATEPRVGAAVAVLGYPENGPFTISPARQGDTRVVISQDSYGRGPITRRMTSFRGTVRSGNSGGPVVDARGRVTATVFAAERGSRPAGALAVPNSVVQRALTGDLAPTDTGPCAV